VFASFELGELLSRAPHTCLEEHPRPGTRQQQVKVSTLTLLQGTVDLLVLRALQTGPSHGYSVSRWVRERTDGVLAIEDAALYQALLVSKQRG
jgi:hypothetical protein